MEIDTTSFFIEQESFPTFMNQLDENEFIRHIKDEKVYPPMA